MAVSDISRFGIQRKIVANMTTQSWNEIPHVSFIYEPDVTHFIDEYKKFCTTLPEGVKITLNTVVLKAITEALKVAPQMNAHLLFEKKLVRGKVTQYSNIDISVPWILPNDQMMTINCKDMGSRSLLNMTEYMAQMGKKIEKTNLDEAMYTVSFHDTIEVLKKGHFIKALMRLFGSKTGNHKVKVLKGEEKKAYYAIPESERLTLTDLQQGTITVSNVGGITRQHPGSLAMLMIIPPQVCVVGVGALQKTPRVFTDKDGNDTLGIAQVLPLCICFDHRALDFGEIKPFLDKMSEIFENPEQILKLD